MSGKTNPGNFFEDFEIGQELVHATPRTVTEGETALYTALYGGRFALQSADRAAQDIGYPGAPIDDWLVFHIVFGKTVPDVSLNAVANLGYAQGRFLLPVYPGDTLSATSTVIGLKENSNGKTGTVYVNSVGRNQEGRIVLDYCRWVMIRKRDESAPAPEPVVPDLPDRVDPATLAAPGVDLADYDPRVIGQPHRFGDYKVGEKIDHVDGVTIEEAEHMMATRLYQNTAKVHFNQHTEGEGRFGRRLVYGGHIISLARGLSYNGLAPAMWIAAINAGGHTAPCFAGDTVYAWSEILETADLDGPLGALRIRTVACKNGNAAEFPYMGDDGKYARGVVLDLDYWALIAK
ncbi:MAG: MaoC family dehydratase [Minwuia sp.]|uniref:MaoC family dehydratase n=1 Tax=Minwuia sp. TaxID=2493630 RepID=UPI003A84FE96